MDPWYWILVFMVATPVSEGWRSSSEEERKEVDRQVHYHTKRHMVPSADDNAKKRPTAPVRGKETRKKVKAKPSGHLTPLKEDDIDNDEVVSVAIGPPPMRPMYDKLNWRPRASKNMTLHSVPTASETSNFPSGAISLVKDVLTQIGRDFLTHPMNEDFVFGQYVGQAMRNITNGHKLQFQHDILELVIKYQKLSSEETKTKSDEKKDSFSILKDMKDSPRLKGLSSNDTDENWPEFTNLSLLDKLTSN